MLGPHFRFLIRHSRWGSEIQQLQHLREARPDFTKGSWLSKSRARGRLLGSFTNIDFTLANQVGRGSRSKIGTRLYGKIHRPLSAFKIIQRWDPWLSPKESTLTAIFEEVLRFLNFKEFMDLGIWDMEMVTLGRAQAPCSRYLQCGSPISSHRTDMCSQKITLQ